MSRGEWDGLLGALSQAGLVEMEEAEYEKDGEVRRFRKVRLTEAGQAWRTGSGLELLLSDGVVDEFGVRDAGKSRSKKAPAKGGTAKGGTAKGGSEQSGLMGTHSERATPPVGLTAAEEEVAARLKEWRSAEAKRLGVPAYVVLHDRTLTALAQARPNGMKEMLEIDGIGPAKLEKYGAAILEICGRVVT